MIAMSLEDGTQINLSEVLIIAYPVIPDIVVFIARFFAGKSIKPIDYHNLGHIPKHTQFPNLLPQNRDEIVCIITNHQQFIKPNRNCC
jgi:hypothetical protein